MHPKLLLSFIIGLFFYQSHAQGVLISDEPGQTHPSAVLDVRSDEKGLLIPSMTTSERNAIPEPYDGLMLYNISEGYLNVYDSVEDEWYELEPLHNLPPLPEPPPAILPGQSKVLSAVDFRPSASEFPGNANYVSNPTAAYFSSGFGRMFAPISLPVGSHIYSLTIYYYDNNPDSGLRVGLVEQTLGSNNDASFIDGHITAGEPTSTDVQQVQVQLEHLVAINKSLAISVEVTDGWNLHLGIQAVVVGYLLPTE